ncbi:hypothetical protein HCDSEM_053 [Candidatus Hodgkinia cicadicola Dsem]|nr:hypothetical protein HCDSEM_053 [Candidatus Hodgkinia cicadicola Dsem]
MCFYLSFPSKAEAKLTRQQRLRAVLSPRCLKLWALAFNAYKLAAWLPVRSLLGLLLSFSLL